MFELDTVGGDLTTEMVEKKWDVEAFFVFVAVTAVDLMVYLGLYRYVEGGRGWTEVRWRGCILYDNTPSKGRDVY